MRIASHTWKMVFVPVARRPVPSLRDVMRGFRVTLLFVIGLRLGTAAEDPLQALLANNPFLPDTPAKPAPPEPSPTVEFRGRSVEHGVEYFSLYDTTTKKARWVKRDGQVGSLRVRERDPQGALLLVNAAGKITRLTLKEAKFAGTASVVTRSAPPALASATLSSAPLAEATPARGNL